MKKRNPVRKDKKEKETSRMEHENQPLTPKGEQIDYAGEKGLLGNIIVVK